MLEYWHFSYSDVLELLKSWVVKMDDSQVSNTEKYVNSAHSPSTACILQSTAPLVQILQDNNSLSVSTNLFSPWRAKLRDRG